MKTTTGTALNIAVKFFATVEQMDDRVGLGQVVIYNNSWDSHMHGSDRDPMGKFNSWEQEKLADLIIENFVNADLCVSMACSSSCDFAMDEGWIKDNAREFIEEAQEIAIEKLDATGRYDFS